MISLFICIEMENDIKSLMLFSIPTLVSFHICSLQVSFPIFMVLFWSLFFWRSAADHAKEERIYKNVYIPVCSRSVLLVFFRIYSLWKVSFTGLFLGPFGILLLQVRSAALCCWPPKRFFCFLRVHIYVLFFWFFFLISYMYIPIDYFSIDMCT